MATEEQTDYNGLLSLYAGGYVRAGQRLTIANRTITKLSFPLSKVSSPTGDVTFTIRKIADNILASKVWGNAADLTTSIVWYEVTFNTPVTINEEVRILVEFSGGDNGNYVRYSFQSTDVKADETITYYGSSYVDNSDYDGAYIYTYGVVKKGPLPMHFRV